MKKLLVVEDETKLRNELKSFLENNGYLVNEITDFSDTLNSIVKSECDLILLDINLPNANGEFLCKELRKSIQTPIIIVTSRNTDIDELLCINYGADDFITKPYNPQILLARINRLLSRGNCEIITYKNAIIDVSKSVITTENSKLDLSRNEIKILFYLLSNKGTIISRDQMINYLWDNDEFVDDNTLTVNINRLRTKLESIGLKDVVETKRGQGYIIL